jgi:hypothetical protein
MTQLNPISNQVPQKPPTEPKTCPDCKIKHNWVLEDVTTGKVIEVFERCKGCMIQFGTDKKVEFGPKTIFVDLWKKASKGEQKT